MSKTFSILTLSVTALLPLGRLLAQSPMPAATPSVSTTDAPGTTAESLTSGGGKGRFKALLQSLSPEEHQKLRQARKAAMADPAVQAAKSSGDPRELRKAVHQAMLRDDPSVAPVLAKMRMGAGAPNALGQPGQTIARPQKGGQGMGKNMAYLPEDERTKLTNAYAAANSDPQLVGLRQQWVSATTPEAKAQAGKAYREGIRNAMLRNDPSIAPILQKVHDHNAAQAGIDASSL